MDVEDQEVGPPTFVFRVPVESVTTTTLSVSFTGLRDQCACQSPPKTVSPHSGFSVLQVQGPCPFRIEVTNSEAGTSSSSKWSSSKFVQPQPPTIPVDREAVAMPNARKTTKFCLPEPPCGLFGPMAYGAGGRANPGIQRAPINTTPVGRFEFIVS